MMPTDWREIFDDVSTFAFKTDSPSNRYTRDRSTWTTSWDDDNDTLNWFTSYLATTGKMPRKKERFESECLQKEPQCDIDERELMSLLDN